MNAKIRNEQQVIDTGDIEFKLPFKRGNGKIIEESIWFNPNDAYFYNRMFKMKDEIAKHWDEAQKEFDKTDDMVEQLNINEKLIEKVKEEFDKGFGNDVSSVIFKYTSPVSFVKGGIPYPYYILEFLAPKIAEKTEETQKQAAANFEKAMKKHNVEYQHKLK